MKSASRMIAVSLALLMSVLIAPAAQASCAWTQVPTPNRSATDHNFAMAADYAAKDEGWLVGYSWSPNSTPFSMHWDGLKWRMVKTPNPGGESSLTSVASLPDGTAWAVGYATSTGGFRLFFNGKRWVRVKPPSNEPTGASLTAVEALGARNVWAVGSAGSSSVAERWNGRRWKMVPVPDPGGSSDYLTAIDHVPGTKDVWVTGGWSNGPFHPLAFLWHAGAWQTPAVPDPGNAVPEAVAAAGPDDAWIFGRQGSGTPYFTTYTSHWNGSTWTTVAGIDPSTTFPGQFLYGAAASESGKVYADGYFYPSNIDNDALAIRWSGTDWTDISPTPTSEAFDLQGMAAIPGTKKVALIGFERAGGRFETRVLTGC